MPYVWSVLVPSIGNGHQGLSSWVPQLQALARPSLVRLLLVVLFDQRRVLLANGFLSSNRKLLGSTRKPLRSCRGSKQRVNWQGREQEKPSPCSSSSSSFPIQFLRDKVAWVSTGICLLSNPSRVRQAVNTSDRRHRLTQCV